MTVKMFLAAGSRLAIDFASAKIPMKIPFSGGKGQFLNDFSRKNPDGRIFLQFCVTIIAQIRHDPGIVGYSLALKREKTRDAVPFLLTPSICQVGVLRRPLVYLASLAALRRDTIPH